MAGGWQMNVIPICLILSRICLLRPTLDSLVGATRGHRMLLEFHYDI